MIVSLLKLLACLFAFLSILYIFVAKLKARSIYNPKTKKSMPHFISPLDLTKLTHYIDTVEYLRKKFPGEKLVNAQAFNYSNILITDLELAKKVLLRQKEFPRPEFDGERMKQTMATDGLLHKDLNVWSKNRKILNRGFEGSKLSAMWPIFVDFSKKLMKILDKEADLFSEKGSDVLVHLKDLAFDIVAKTSFGREFKTLGSKENAGIGKGFEMLLESDTYWSVILWILTGIKLGTYVDSVVKNYNSIRESCAMTLKERRKKGNTVVPDLLDVMMVKDENEKTILPEQDIIANIFVFFLAGRDTSSNTMGNALYYLAQYPEIQKKLLCEIKTTRKSTGGKKNSPFDEETLKNMKYLNAIIKETQRIKPVVVTVLRTAKKSRSTIDGYKIPKGANILVMLKEIMDKSFESPNEFRPERFMKEDPENKYGFLGFGYGAFSCIGRYFALNEMRLVLTMIVEKYQVLPVEGWKIDYTVLMDLVTPKSIKVRFKKRE